MTTKENRVTKNFYFQEIQKIIYFPITGNQGKYRNYRVHIKTPKTISKNGQPALLGDFLDNPEVEDNYPHTVGYFRDSVGEGKSFKPEYLELRKIYSVEEFWLFLNACNI